MYILFSYYLCIIAVFNSAFQCSQCLKYCHKQCCETADSISPWKGKPDSSINQEILFTAFHNKKISEKKLKKQGIKRVNSWKEIEQLLLKEGVTTK